MITEIAFLHVIGNEDAGFERAFSEAEKIISKMNGYLGHELLRCIEKENNFLLMVRWACLDDHTEGFRKSEEYNRWKKLLHHFYDHFPTVEHYEKIN